jgi:hypothetical protein
MGRRYREERAVSVSRSRDRIRPARPTIQNAGVERLEHGGLVCCGEVASGDCSVEAGGEVLAGRGLSVGADCVQRGRHLGRGNPEFLGERGGEGLLVRGPLRVRRGRGLVAVSERRLVGVYVVARCIQRVGDLGFLQVEFCGEGFGDGGATHAIGAIRATGAAPAVSGNGVGGRASRNRCGLGVRHRHATDGQTGRCNASGDQAPGQGGLRGVGLLHGVSSSCPQGISLPTTTLQRSTVTRLC